MPAGLGHWAHFARKLREFTSATQPICLHFFNTNKRTNRIVASIDIRRSRF